MGNVIWLTGLSASGKSTIAEGIKKRIEGFGDKCCIIDGDQMREGLTKNLGFGKNDRRENVRIAAEVAKLFSKNGMTVVVALITPYEEYRQMARDILGDKYYEVFVECPLGTCIERDPKGLYKRAIDGKILNFTGVSDDYELPIDPYVVVNTDELDVSECVEKIIGECF